MRLRLLPLFMVLATSCGDIDVPFPDPGSDPGTDTGEDAAKEVAGDVSECMKDDDCMGKGVPVCMKARCQDRVCVLDPVGAGEPCVTDPPVVGPCKASECDGKGNCGAVAADDGTDCVPIGGPPGPCETFACEGGQCVGGKGCDDGKPCTEDFCDEGAGQCGHKPLNQGPCDDGNECTLDDHCSAGACTGTMNPCEDGNPCTGTECSPVDGCLYQPDNGVECDDGKLCTLNDKCFDGKCVPGAIKFCSDQNPCTSDSCNPASGDCVFVPNDKECSDKDPCTSGDACKEGKCVPDGPTDCDDGKPCTEDYCDPNEGCLHALQPGCQKCSGDSECDDGNQCTSNKCELDGSVGKCSVVPLTGEPCADQDPCKVGDVCKEGACISGDEPKCFDGNPCTDDVCDPLDGSCDFAPNTLACNDGDDCTVEDHCGNKECAGTPIQCDDQNVCTKDFCEKGACEFVPQDVACDDGNKCTAGDHCEGKSCIGTATDCNDSNPCTVDKCNEDAGCVHSPIVGCLNCTNASDCNDENQCTKDTCNAAFQCEWTPKDGLGCDDGNKCTEPDVCSQSACVPGGTVVCNDDEQCTADSCDPSQGCLYVPIAGTCDDGDPDTGPDQCVEGKCVPGPLLNCQGWPDGTPCSDQDDATDPDYCVGQNCRGFLKTTLSENGEPTWFSDVDAGSGKAFVTGWYGTSDADFTGFVASVAFGGKPSVIQSTTAMGQAYRAVSGLLAVGDDGLVAYSPSWLGGTTWTKSGVVGYALSNQGQSTVGSLSGVFGGVGSSLTTLPTGLDAMPPVPTDCDSEDQYLVVGRFAGDAPSALVRHCVLSQVLIDPIGACQTQASCGKTHVNNAEATMVYPSVASGLAASCGANQSCLKEAVFTGLLADPTGLSFQWLFKGSSGTSGLFEEFSMSAGLAASAGTVRDAVRTTDTDGNGVYLLVGDGGLVAYGPDSGPLKQVVISNNPSDYNFASVATGGGYVLMAGTRTDQDAKALVLVLHPIDEPLDDQSSYTELVIDWCPSQPCGSFDLSGVSAVGGNVFVSGSVTSGTSSSAAGVMYFLVL